MLGRDLIVYIIQHHLENEEIYQDGKLLGFMSDVEAAEKFGVGIATIRVWVNQDRLKAILIGDKMYIPADSENPSKFIGE